ncbi:Haem-NO-binding [Cnuella takakiae]|uniref:Haem-NO-binding n=1 Tax=Cnuella takakiae TaxID=1302690 RepID=A0A1M5IKC9_9BACT|nr:heme NO-binding domain-containing protein [Cnuella takakiae]OLY92216.1 heme NO-binding protein [Cnuella takakiae]SHG28695.1 Haem-NO-binding [Cnuella takakiae]
MYGIVNKAIQELVSEQFGSDAWIRVKQKSGVGVDFFSSNEPYPDDITFKLARAASEELKLPLDEVLRAFGHFWIMRTGKERYGALMEAGGSNLHDFLMSLPQFHNRILLMFPQLCPPEFVVKETGTGAMEVHYYSQRQGLEIFVQGLLEGLGLLYNTPITVSQTQTRANGHDHAIFAISWQ